VSPSRSPGRIGWMTHPCRGIFHLHLIGTRNTLTFALENLVLRSSPTNSNMVKNHHWPKNISDAASGNLLLVLASKAQNAGKPALKVPTQDTYQACSGRGAVVPKSLTVHLHCCESCELPIDRDHNSALNILNRNAVANRGQTTLLKRETHTITVEF